MHQNKIAAAVAAAYGLLLAAAIPAHAQNAAALGVSAVSAEEAEQSGAAANTAAADASLEVIARVTVSTRRRNAKRADHDERAGREKPG